MGRLHKCNGFHIYLAFSVFVYMFHAPSLSFMDFYELLYSLFKSFMVI